MLRTIDPSTFSSIVIYYEELILMPRRHERLCRHLTRALGSALSAIPKPAIHFLSSSFSIAVHIYGKIPVAGEAENLIFLILGVVDVNLHVERELRSRDVR